MFHRYCQWVPAALAVLGLVLMSAGNGLAQDGPKGKGGKGKFEKALPGKDAKGAANKVTIDLDRLPPGLAKQLQKFLDEDKGKIKPEFGKGKGKGPFGFGPGKFGPFGFKGKGGEEFKKKMEEFKKKMEEGKKKADEQKAEESRTSAVEQRINRLIQELEDLRKEIKKK